MSGKLARQPTEPAAAIRLYGANGNGVTERQYGHGFYRNEYG